MRPRYIWGWQYPIYLDSPFYSCQVWNSKGTILQKLLFGSSHKILMLLGNLVIFCGKWEAKKIPPASIAQLRVPIK
jgi:hypothetical protein